MEKGIITLNKMEAGQSGKVVEIHAGDKMTSRLSGLGIIVGKMIKKISQQVMRGPVIVEVDRSQVAVGFGMATRILVEIKGD